jgi:gliding motility-associated-like protein
LYPIGEVQLKHIINIKPLTIFAIKLARARLGNMKNVIIFFFITFSIFQSFGNTIKSIPLKNYNLELPQKSISTIITCIQTDLNGNVTINWTQASDPTNSFTEYQIHTVQNGLLATINSINTTSYTHQNVTQKFDYFITTISNLDGYSSTETISNIFLTVNNPSDGTAILQWNNPSPTKLPSMGSYCKIVREYPLGIWTLRDSVPYGTTFFKDTIDVCQAFLNYKIIVPNQSCDYVSNSKGDNFKDIISPDIPIISQVSIDTLTNNLVITWNKNKQSDTQGYIIYSIDNNGFASEITRLNGLSNTSFSYNPSLNSNPLTYSVAAFDFCLTNSIDPTFQTSAKAEVHTPARGIGMLDICNRDVKLSWTEYKGWSSILNYEIWGKKEGEQWIKLGSTNSFDFHTIGEATKNYCFVIKAISLEGKESFSNRICLTITAPSQPSYNYLKTSTVNGNKIELHHYVEVISGVKEVIFQRLNNSIFEEIGRSPVNQSEIIFIDPNVFVDKNSYTYRVVVLDSCGNLGSISNIAKTMVLTIQTNKNEMKNYLNWSKYETFNGSTLGYKIYRGFDGVFSPEPLAVLSNSQFYYEDEFDKVEYSGKTCYYVEAFEGVNKYGLQETSQSNSSCAVTEPITFIPNAFTPNGDRINEIFLPKVSIFDYSSYQLIIFDRWEHVLFETTNSEIGWNGTIKSSGKMADPGSYVYLLKINDGNGIEIIKRGHINLLK